MSDTSKYMVMGSMGVAGLVGVASIVDMIMGVPFAQSMFLDIMFLLGSAIVLYMAWDTYQEMG